MKKKAGRPRKKSHTEMFSFRVGPKRKAKWERAADAAEMSLSEWIRCRLDDAADRELK